MTMLVTGADGKLGKEICKVFPDAIKTTHKELALENFHGTYELVNKIKPTTVVHLAAMTAPPKCESNKVQAWKSTIEGTQNLLLACRIVNPKCYFVLMSTPCVLDGDDENDKDESAIPYPKDQFYGFTKAVQERMVMASSLRFCIIRANFVDKASWPYPKAFTDRHSYYIYTHQLAQEIKKIVENGLEGIVHVQGDKKLSMFELAKISKSDVLPTTLEEYYAAGNKTKLTKNMCIVSKRWPPVKFEG